jgi:hypothetical protein
MKLFDHHFCDDRCPIFVYHLHVSGPTAMHKFGVVLVLLPKQYAISFSHINLLVVHSETRHNLLALVYVFRHVMLHWDEINNQLHNIIVALI